MESGLQQHLVDCLDSFGKYVSRLLKSSVTNTAEFDFLIKLLTI